MSMRMNAVHDIVNSYSKPGMGVNGMPPGGCGNDGKCFLEYRWTNCNGGIAS